MPYIAIKAYPKDEETKKRVAEKSIRCSLKSGAARRKRFRFQLKNSHPKIGKLT